VSAPLVSILIPAYNCQPWVARAIDSALAQTWPNLEIIVVDDGSTDGTTEALQAYAGRVRLERQPNGGQNVSRNRLTAWSRGEWLVYLDADDELAPDAVERKMARRDDADAIYGSLDLQHFDGKTMTRSERKNYEDHQDWWAAAFQWQFPNTSAFMLRRAAVLDAGGWNEAIRSCTDYDLHFRFLAQGRRFRAAPDSVSVYRFWDPMRQASMEDHRRMTTTRLAVMWRGAASLDQLQAWTPAARLAFTNAAMNVIRSLYVIDPRQAIVEFQKLVAANPKLRLSPQHFPAPYRVAFKLLGFSGAERVAALMRKPA